MIMQEGCTHTQYQALDPFILNRYVLDLFEEAWNLVCLVRNEKHIWKFPTVFQSLHKHD